MIVIEWLDDWMIYNDRITKYWMKEWLDNKAIGSDYVNEKPSDKRQSEFMKQQLYTQWNQMDGQKGRVSLWNSSFTHIET